MRLQAQHVVAQHVAQGDPVLFVPPSPSRPGGYGENPVPPSRGYGDKPVPPSRPVRGGTTPSPNPETSQVSYSVVSVLMSGGEI